MKKKKEKREKKGKLKEGTHWACAKMGPDHATVTTVRLGAHYSDECAWEHITVTMVQLDALICFLSVNQIQFVNLSIQSLFLTGF